MDPRLKNEIVFEEWLRYFRNPENISTQNCKQLLADYDKLREYVVALLEYQRDSEAYCQKFKIKLDPEKEQLKTKLQDVHVFLKLVCQRFNFNYDKLSIIPQFEKAILFVEKIRFMEESHKTAKNQDNMYVIIDEILDARKKALQVLKELEVVVVKEAYDYDEYFKEACKTSIFGVLLEHIAALEKEYTRIFNKHVATKEGKSYRDYNEIISQPEYKSFQHVDPRLELLDKGIQECRKIIDDNIQKIYNSYTFGYCGTFNAKTQDLTKENIKAYQTLCARYEQVKNILAGDPLEYTDIKKTQESNNEEKKMLAKLNKHQTVRVNKIAKGYKDEVIRLFNETKTQLDKTLTSTVSQNLNKRTPSFVTLRKIVNGVITGIMWAIPPLTIISIIRLKKVDKAAYKPLDTKIYKKSHGAVTTLFNGIENTKLEDVPMILIETKFKNPKK